METEWLATKFGGAAFAQELRRRRPFLVRKQTFTVPQMDVYTLAAEIRVTEP